MSLSVVVGTLAFCLIYDKESADFIRKEFAEINQILSKKGLPEHHEPEFFPCEHYDYRGTTASFDYSDLNRLRGVAAYYFGDKNRVATDFPENTDPMDDPVSNSVTHSVESDLICLSDSQGMYLPIDFGCDWVPWDDRFPRRFLGSSQKLLSEIVQIAPALQIKLDEKGEISDEEFERVRTESFNKSSRWREKSVWLRLFVCATLSIKYQTAIDIC